MQSDRNPWLGILTKPRETIRAIIERNPNFRIIPLSIIYSLPSLFLAAQKLSMGAGMNSWVIVILCIVLALPIGWLGFCINSLFLLWTGKLLKGKGSFKNIRAAFAWSSVPNIVNVAIWGILLFAFGGAVFMSTFPTTLFAGAHGFLLQTAFVAQVVAAIWMLVIFVKALGEVQGFSAWMGLLNVVLGVILWMVMAYFIGYVLSLFGSGAM